MGSRLPLPALSRHQSCWRLSAIAEAAMALAATPDNRVHAQHIVGTVRARDSPQTTRAEGDPESEGGRLAS